MGWPFPSLLLRWEVRAGRPDAWEMNGNENQRRAMFDYVLTAVQ